MRKRHPNSAWLVLLIIFFAIAQPLAQQRTDTHTTDQLRKANRKIALGLALMGAGALAAPLTAMARRDGDPGGPAMNVSSGMISVGSGVTWWGATERRRALQPQTAIRVDISRGVAFQFRRIR